MNKRIKTAPPPRCGHGTTIGSYPGERYVSCGLAPLHDGEHEGTVSWEQNYLECDGCSMQKRAEKALTDGKDMEASNG